MAKLKVGIIGAGAISRDHCSGVNSHPDAEMVAVADINAKRRDAVKRQFGMAKAYATAGELLADDSLDAVCIALPNALHAPVALDALAAGKHVLLDKPFAMNAGEAKAVIAASKKAGKLLMIGMNQRYPRDSQTIRALVKRGDLGNVYHARAFWRRRAGAPRFGTWFGDKRQAGGGCLLDIGVHLLDLCLFSMDNFKPVSASGAVYTKFGNRGLGEGGWGHSDPQKGKQIFTVDDFATALIKFQNGATVDLTVSWVLHQATPDQMDVELFGTEAGASIKPARVYRFGKNKGEYEVVEPQNITIDRPHCNRQIDWIDGILKRRKPACTLEESLTVQKILDAIYKSSETGKEVRIR